MNDLDNITEKEVIFDSFTLILDAIKNGEIRVIASDEEGEQ